MSGPTATAVYTDLPAKCLPLKGTTTCPEFANLHAYIPRSVNIRDVAGFDALMRDSLDLSSNPDGFGGMTRSVCPASDGTGI
ncbi:hypothetical protein HDU81_002281 [Chytriomyces hyalinus]|nr:hypothetical protein HDU81_002281 [Chytriomyces hyalinus]